MRLLFVCFIAWFSSSLSAAELFEQDCRAIPDVQNVPDRSVSNVMFKMFDASVWKLSFGGVGISDAFDRIRPFGIMMATNTDQFSENYYFCSPLDNEDGVPRPLLIYKRTRKALGWEDLEKTLEEKYGKPVRVGKFGRHQKPFAARTKKSFGRIISREAVLDDSEGLFLPEAVIWYMSETMAEKYFKPGMAAAEKKAKENNAAAEQEKKLKEDKRKKAIDNSL